jgi:predicted ester cyclase
MGTPASGKEVQLTGISIYRIEGGKIAQEWSVEDEYGLMAQIGTVAEIEQ